MMLSNRNIKYFKKAKSLTELSDFNKIHIGAIAVYKGEVIGVGYNTYKTHPKQKKYDKYRILHTGSNCNKMHAMHAEMMCLASIKRKDIKWDKVELYIYRKRISNPFGLCKPCPACLNAIKDYGIKHIYYTSDEGYVYEYLKDAQRKLEIS